MTDAPHPPSSPVDLTSGESFAAIHRWIANGQIDDAARARARQHSLEHQATEDATLLGALIDLAERGRPVTATTSATRRVTGSVVAVGADFAILRDGRLGDVFVPVERLAVVRPAPGDGLPTGNRLAGISLTLGSALMELATERPDVIVATGGEDIRGEMFSVGADMVTIAIDRARRNRLHIRLGGIDHLVVLAR